MKNHLPLFVLVAALSSSPLALFGDNATWTGAQDADLAKAGNWSGGSLCGSLSDATTRDAATFRGQMPTSQLAPSVDWYVGTVSFSEQNGATAWRLGTGAAGDPAIHLCGIGSGSITFSYANAANTVVDLAGPLVIENIYQFNCDPSAEGSSLRIGRLSASGNYSVQLKGAGTSGVVYGPVSDGDGVVAISKLHDGTWTLKGENTFTGVVSINRGTLVAGGDVGALGVAGPFGANATQAAGLSVRVGDPNPSVDCIAALLLGYNDDGTPVTFRRDVQSQQNNKIATVSQPAHFGGANTNGVTRFTSIVRAYRPCVLKCAAGGTVAFSGTVNPYDRPVGIGTADFAGTVRLETSLNTSSGVTCDYGTLDVCADLKAATTVNAGAVVTSSSTDGKGVVSGALTVAAGGILAGGATGTLSVSGALAMASGAYLRFESAERQSPSIVVGGGLSLDGVRVAVEGERVDFAQAVPLLRADGGLSDVDALEVASVPRRYVVFVRGDTIYGQNRPGTVFTIR